MPSEPRWLRPENIVDLNRLIVADTGEPFLLRDAGLLESALQKPLNRWAYESEDDAVTLAVTLLFGLAQNHPFLQGNKRTAFVAALLFLEANGYELDAPDTPIISDLIVKVIARQLTELEFADAIRSFVRPLS